MGYDTSRLSETADLLRALASPVRLAIVLELEREPRCVHDLVERLGVSQPVASQHLRVLRGLRLVRGDRRGREVVYALSDSHAAKLARDAIEHVTEGPLMIDQTTTHETHPQHAHTHDGDCGHAAVPHDDHSDFLHDGHAHQPHGDHYDEHKAAGHVSHMDHEHAHAADCGHQSIEHGDHVDHVHDGHRHAEHTGHYDEH